MLREFAIFLEKKSAGPIPLDCVRAHVEGLRRLDEAGRLVAAGPFGDGKGGLILARFADREEAERFASQDPFVSGGHEAAQVRPWEWSHRGNGHLGVTEPEPDRRFLATLRDRSTARRFDARPVDEGLVRALLEAAHRAPSEFNLQPWRPVVCLSREAKERLRDCCLGQEQAAHAAVDVIVAVSTSAFGEDAPRAVDEVVAAGRWPAEERDERLAFVRGCYPDAAALRLHAVANGMLFGHQLLLAAVSVGLAGFWLGGFEEDKLRRAFGIPDDAVIAGVVGLGWPGDPEPRLPRLPLASVVSWERWGAAGKAASAPR